MEGDICRVAPPDWVRLPVEAVCARVTSGGTPSRSRPEFYSGLIPWVKTKELRDGWVDETEEHINEDAIAVSSAKLLPANTVLVAMYGATAAMLGILRRPMTCNQACCALVVDPQRADMRFLFYSLYWHRAQLKKLAVGAAQQNLSGSESVAS